MYRPAALNQEFVNALPKGTTSVGGALLERLQAAFGPLAGGMLLDVADVLSFGPTGLFVGALVGAPLGWWLASTQKMSWDSKLLMATAAGVYCAFPGTGLIPLATLTMAGLRFFESGRSTNAGASSVAESPANAAESSRPTNASV